jgi:hypothetical protein
MLPSDSSEDDLLDDSVQRTAIHPGMQPPPVSLSLNDLESPAILIDEKLKLAWYNTASDAQIWHHALKASNGSPKPNLFDLLLSTTFRAAVDNWRSWVTFFVDQFRAVVPDKLFRNRIELMDPATRERLGPLIDTLLDSPAALDSIYSGSLRQMLTSGEVVNFHTIATNFQNGRLIIFNPIQKDHLRQSEFSKRRIEHRIRSVRRYPNPVRLPYYILSVELDRPDIVKLEMLEDAYSRMTNAIWNQCVAVIERFGGVFGKHTDGGCYGQFLPGDAFENNVGSAIQCSLELGEAMDDLSREYKLRWSWTHDLKLNIGLHREHGFIGALSSSAGDTLFGMGDGLRTAAQLSSLAHNGQILASKSVFDHMPSEVQERLRFGIYRRESGMRSTFMPNLFTSIGSNADAGKSKAVPFEELRGIGVTQIFDFTR